MNDDRFIELLLKELSEEEILPEEREELAQYLKNKDYAGRYRLFKRYWSQHNSDAVNNEALFEKVRSRLVLEAVDAPTAGIEVRKEETASRPRFFRWQYAAAVVMIGVCSLLLFRVVRHEKTDAGQRWKEQTTARGRKVSFVLPDGTRVSLNSGSKLRFPEGFSGKEREVYLSGEAFFDVKRDTLHPFIIHTEKMNVRVLGTAFNVKAYADEPFCETTLIRGSVEVTLKDRPADKVILRPSEKLIVNYSPPEARPGLPDKAETQARQAHALTQITYMHKEDSVIVETSWLQNKLFFKGEHFAEIARSLERRYNIDIHFAGEELKQLRFTATFDNETVDEVLKALKFTEPFRYRIEGNSVYIY